MPDESKQPAKKPSKSDEKSKTTKNTKGSETSTTPSDSDKANAQTVKAGESSKQTQPTKGPPTATTPQPHKRKRKLHAIEVLLGENLVNAAGEKKNPTDFVVEDGIVGLYFGATWCPPCRELHPHLLLLYEEVRKAGHKFDIVYVPSDHNEETFKQNLSKMPWWAVDFKDEELRENLEVAYNVRGIPMFIIIDATTLEVINREGRYFAATDPRGKDFPWRDMPVPDFFTDILLKLIAAAKEYHAQEQARKEKEKGAIFLPSTSSKKETIKKEETTKAESDDTAASTSATKAASQQDTSKKDSSHSQPQADKDGDAKDEESK